MTEPVPSVQQRLAELAPAFPHWQKTLDLVDQYIDIILNYRQSGHPGGSRSKMHALLATLLSGAMRWDIRQPEKRFGDRFILVAGHTVPMIYCTLAVLNEAMRLRYEQTGDRRYAFKCPPERVLTWQDLLGFRLRGGLPGHAEMSGKTLFLKFNTGPSGHGSPVAAGEALALKRAGAGQVRVFAFEGEGGLTAGAAHETLNSAWGLALDNLYFVVDWNDFGIDEHAVSCAVFGTPQDWFVSHGWRTYGTEQGSQFEPVTAALLAAVMGENPAKAPGMVWAKTRKGRGYNKYDFKSHGAPHARDSELFWETRRPFMERYGAGFINFGGPAPTNPAALQEEFRANLQAVNDVLRADQALVDYLSDTLADLGDVVPEEVPAYRLSATTPFKDGRLWDYHNYPADLFVPPGSKAPNRAALGKWGAWINAFAAKQYGRPVFLASSADLAESTNISGFAKGYGDFPGYGWYERCGDERGVLLPQEITEFANAGISAGLTAVNFSTKPEEEFDGFYAACSTYGSFSYLKYGPMRLFSQFAQDCDLKTGKLLWVAGHSGPETADDSRTHFGIFAPGVTQLFPKGQVINLYPWEHNEVPVLLGAAFAQKAPIVALHLTRPEIEIPDRAALGIPSHFEAARGAYILRDYLPGQPHGGTLIVQGTSAIVGMVKLLPELAERGLNVKVVCACSPELFALQPQSYQEIVIAAADRPDSTVITTMGRALMNDWIFNPLAEEYALSSDWDDRWRTGGTLDEVLDEAHLSPEWLLKGIERFVRERPKRLASLQDDLQAALEW